MANQFNFQGVLTQDETKQTQKGKSFHTFTIERTEDGYAGPKAVIIKVTAFGPASDQVRGIPQGAEVVVTGKIESREWQGKHYVDLKAISVAEADSYE